MSLILVDAIQNFMQKCKRLIKKLNDLHYVDSFNEDKMPGDFENLFIHWEEKKSSIKLKHLLYLNNRNSEHSLELFCEIKNAFKYLEKKETLSFAEPLRAYSKKAWVLKNFGFFNAAAESFRNAGLLKMQDRLEFIEKLLEDLESKVKEDNRSEKRNNNKKIIKPFHGG